MAAERAKSVKLVDTDTGMANLRWLWEHTRDWERERGQRYWTELRAEIGAIAAPFTGFAMHTAVAAFCALSPANAEQQNLKDLDTVLRDGMEAVVHTYPQNLEKAVRLLERTALPIDVLGRKTYSMYLNIMDPEDIGPVTIDGHMVGVWQGQRIRMDDAGINAKQYDVIAEGVRAWKDQVNALGDCGSRHYTAGMVQATMWIAWRRIHRVKWGYEVRKWQREKQMVLGL